MNYRKRGVSSSLEEILAKLRGEEFSDYVPVVYSPADILAAKDVLDRLLQSSTRNEVKSVEVATKELYEE